MRSIRSRCALAAGTAVALCAAAIAGAQEPADPSFSMSVTPRSVSAASTARVVYRTLIRTGAQAERFRVELVPPRYATRLGSVASVRHEGATITPDAEVALEGPGTLTPIGEGMAAVACSPSSGLAAHGYEPRYPSFLVELPARSSATLVARYRTGDVDLWPGSDLRLRLRARRGTYGRGAPTLARDVEVRSPRVAVRGRTAPRVELWTSPRSSPGVTTRLRRIAAGRRLSIRGRVAPARAGRRVSLWMLRHGAVARPRRLATVSTDARGRLRFATTAPARAGSYELWGRTANDAGGRPEHSCSMAFRVP